MANEVACERLAEKLEKHVNIAKGYRSEMRRLDRRVDDAEEGHVSPTMAENIDSWNEASRVAGMNLDDEMVKVRRVKATMKQLGCKQ